MENLLQSWSRDRQIKRKQANLPYSVGGAQRYLTTASGTIFCTSKFTFHRAILVIFLAMANLLLLSRVSTRNAATLFRLLIKPVYNKKPIKCPFTFASSRTFASSSLDQFPKEDLVTDFAGNSTNFTTSHSDPLLDLSEFLNQVPTEAVVEKAIHLTSTDVGLTWWLPTGGVYNILDALSSHFSWWASIAILAVSVRAILLPIMIKNQSKCPLH